MQWTKIPTNILINRLTDQEIVSIVKYQLLWADLEYQPDEKTALRYLTPKQLSIAHQYLDSMESQVTRDVRSSETNRRYRKLNYLKTNKNSENVSITLPITVSNTLQQQNRIEKNNIYIQDSLSASAENPLPLKTTKSDKTDFPTCAEKKPISEGFVEFWKLYPRKINKPLAEKKYIKALTKTTADNILKGLKHYIAEIEKFNTEEKYIKHPATWLNQECWVFEEELKYQPKLDDEIRAKL